MDCYSELYIIRSFRQIKTSYPLAKASEVTKFIVQELKKAKIEGVFDNIFYKLEKCVFYHPTEERKINKKTECNFIERIAIIPKIANNNPLYSHNINIVVDVSCGIVMLYFGKTAEGYPFHSIESFAESKLEELIETITQIQKQQICSVYCFLGKEKYYYNESFEENMDKEKLIELYSKRIKVKTNNKKQRNEDKINSNTYLIKYVWNEEKTPKYKLHIGESNE